MNKKVIVANIAYIWLRKNSRRLIKLYYILIKDAFNSSIVPVYKADAGIKGPRLNISYPA